MFLTMGPWRLPFWPTPGPGLVTFKSDLAKFQMTHLEDGVVALMKKRVVDLAGCLAACPGKKVKVLLNGQEIEVKSFHEYAQRYLNSANKYKDFPLLRYKKLHDYLFVVLLRLENYFERNML